MSCNDGELLAAAITYLADKLYDKSCCSTTPGSYGGPGSFGAGTTGPTELLDDPGETPPDGFDTIAEYRVYKCAVATKIANDIASDIEKISTIQLVGITIAGLLPTLAILLLDPIPGDEIMALAAILIGVGKYGSDTLDAMSNAANNAIDDVICALFNADGAEGAKTDALDILNTAMESETADTVKRAYADQIFSYMLNYFSLNRLFERDEIAATYPVGNCSDCIEGDHDFWVEAFSYYSNTITQQWIDQHTVDVFVHLDGGPDAGVSNIGGWLTYVEEGGDATGVVINEYEVTAGSWDGHTASNFGFVYRPGQVALTAKSQLVSANQGVNDTQGGALYNTLGGTGCVVRIRMTQV